MKLLLVEDEKALAAAITRALTEDGHFVTWMPDGQLAYDHAIHHDYDLILLDVMLPKKNGWEILTGLRGAKVFTPILMLTAMDEVENRVKGLELGADDYLPKPFDTSELISRVHALLRRDSTQKGAMIVVDDLVIDRQRRSVTRAGRRIELTRREYDLLEALATNQDRVLSSEMIQERVWGDEQGISNLVAVYVGSLRRKLDSPPYRKLIYTSIGFGYVLRVEG